MITLNRRMQKPGVWRVLVWYLCVATGVLSVLSSVGEASLVPSGGVGVSGGTERAEEITSRLDQLSDAQLHQVASQIEALQPGGDAAGLVIAVLLIVTLVIVLIYLLDRRAVAR